MAFKARIILLAIVIVGVEICLCDGAGAGNKSNKIQSSNKETGDEVESRPVKGIGISAWGLVALIVSAILTGVAAYYFALFYPILCKKERKYDRIELSQI